MAMHNAPMYVIALYVYMYIVQDELHTTLTLNILCICKAFHGALHNVAITMKAQLCTAKNDLQDGHISCHLRCVTITEVVVQSVLLLLALH